MLVITMSSSSTSRTCGCSLSVKHYSLSPLRARVFERDANVKRGALAQLGFEIDFTAMGVLNDLTGDRQAQPGPFADRLGSEARGKDFRPDLKRYSGSIIGHGDVDQAAFGASTHGDRPFIGYG